MLLQTNEVAVEKQKVEELEEKVELRHRDDRGGARRTANEKRMASVFANNALADVVQDFEKTLERSRTKSTSVERDTTPDREEENRRRTFDSRQTTREKFFQEYGEYRVFKRTKCFTE